MKKLVFILFVGLLFASCEKEIVAPNGVQTDVPEWKERNAKSCNSEVPVLIPTHGGTVTNTGGSITDPNDDEDGNGKKRKK